MTMKAQPAETAPSPQRQIGSRIRAFRKQAGLTQSDLAERVDVSTAYINLIEKNKRNVAGKLLNDIILALDIERDQLLRGITTEALERLQQTARKYQQELAETKAELDQIDYFTSRFPGWAALLDRQIIDNENLEHLSEQLSDRLAHDPVLAETVHIMLSNISAIRSTSELLTMYGNIPEDKRIKFIQNIFLESKRLSTTAEKMLFHLDPSQGAEDDDLSSDQAVKSATGQNPIFMPEHEAPVDDDMLTPDQLIDTLFEFS